MAAFHRRQIHLSHLLSDPPVAQLINQQTLQSLPTMFNDTKSGKTVLVVAVALAVLTAFTGGAAAIATLDVTPEDDGTGDTTTYTIDATIEDTTESTEFSMIELSHGNDIDGDSIDTADITLDGAEVSVSEIESSSDSTEITFESNQELDATQSDLTVEVSDVENPDDAGEYDFTVTLGEGDGTTITEMTDAVAIAVGDTPSVTDTSELANGSTVTYEGNDDLADIVEVESNTDNLELRVYDDDAAIYTSSDFETVADATDTEPGTYEFNLSQDAYSGAELDVNETSTVTVAVENLDGDDAVNMFDVELDNEGTTSQAHVSTNELMNPSVFDVESETVEPGFVQQTLFDAENVTTYEVSSERTIDGDNSVVSLSVSDDDFAADIDDAADELDDGDIVNGMALAHDEGVALVSLNEPADHTDTDEDTYGVYYADEDRVNLYLGDEYADANSVEVTLANMPATEIEAAEIVDVADAYSGSELGIRDLNDDLGWMDAFRVADSSFAFDIPTLDWGPLGDSDENSFVIGQTGV